MRLNMPSMRFLGGVIDFKDPYHAESIGSIETDGFAFMALAENRLMWDRLKPRVMSAMQNLPDSAFAYIPMQGQVVLRQALSQFLERRVMKVPVPPKELVCGTGVSAILSNLFYCICDDGDTVLIPSPYYSAFDSDLRAFCNLHRRLVPLDLDPSSDYRLTAQALECAYHKAYCATGRAPKALLLTNPHNPLGRIAHREELEEVLEWCTGKGMHLVSDEIYALSCFGEEMRGSGRRVAVGSHSFVSIAEICKGKLGDNVHIIWGVSKDFGMAGVRVGMLWTQNGLLLEALRNASKFTSVSGPTQAMVTDILRDSQFTDSYICENARRLGENCDFLLGALERLGVSFVVPSAGMFVWADLWQLLVWMAAVDGGSPCELEEELRERLINEVRIAVNPGAAHHAAKPGWFRICYASISLPVLQDAMNRFSTWVGELRAAAAGV
eukprot:TRINITY_DN44644_c0_g1_i1.p1 TRINITY_DN44644_c0_g1~~TRINITY_DN44644_c0_g1_i1.p1  ORF type:complete len:495 (-),score=59.91 TRINITY_DN44644_c0_g1_i1:442-1761(-)